MKKLFLFALMAASAHVSAEKLDYKFDVQHTQIIFFANHLGFSKSDGQFTNFTGGFSFDPDNWSNSSINVKIHADSIDMGHEGWNRHMKNSDFFNVSKYPKITFESTAIVSLDSKTGTVIGNLTLLGVTRSVLLNVQFNKMAVHPYSKKLVAGFSATSVIKRTDFGMKYGVPEFGDEVELRLEVEGYRKADKASK